MGLRAKKTVGLALGGGAARGLAHVGVLKVLEKAGIPIDMIAGTSAGALIGALYAQGKNAVQIEELVLEQLDWKKLPRLLDLTVPRTGLIAGKHLTDLMRKIIGGDLEFSDLKIPFASTATDIDTGEEVVINQGSVVQAIRASISIPVIFALASYQGRRLVDGILTNPVPAGLVREMGASYTIAVNVLPDSFEALPGPDGKAVANLAVHNIFNVLTQSIYITTHQLIEACLENADYVIQPQVGYIGASEFLRVREIIIQGELVAQAAIPEIKSKLKV